MGCSYENCLLEIEADRGKIQQFWVAKTGGIEPRQNSVKIVTAHRDHPLGVPKSGMEVGCVYFQWLAETAFQKVRLHLVREYQTEDKELAQAVDSWLTRKLDELWIVSGEAIRG